ncbi:hypothetical protein KSP40_PGU019808 [Platanthera guangdongensis]|uniref:Uncharacterized protein n=1 Tax=Platanthera guangdongensis TaxID=2320717 RepID=A0ABR2MMN5_9ASPA
MSSSSIEVTFLIDRVQKRSVYVEAGGDFVDVLFSFLTLPLGAIVRLLKKNSGLGSLDSLYESIELLDAKHLQTEACKEMLLNPRSAAAQLCENLKVKGIHERNPSTFYTCSQDRCLIHSTCHFAYTSKVRCSRCGRHMDSDWSWGEETSEEGGVFVKTATKFLITDDLRVMSASSWQSDSILREMHIKDKRVLEKRLMQFGTKEALKLLGRSLVSKNALAEVCFPDPQVHESASSSLPIKEETVVEETQNEIKAGLISNKRNNGLLYAEVGDDFINQLFSLLTFPLGSVLKILSDNMSPLDACIQNLYSSINGLFPNPFKSEICRKMLLTPKLATFYGYKYQLVLRLEEITTMGSIVKGSCVKCYADNGFKSCSSTQCVHGIRVSQFVEQNPKSVKGLLDNGGGFVVGRRRFIVMDNLHVSLPSAISTIVNGENVSMSDLVGKELFLDNCTARSLLCAMVISKTVLTDVFAPRRKLPRRNNMKHVYGERHAEVVQGRLRQYNPYIK